MKLEVHSRIEENHEKVESTVQYYANSILKIEPTDKLNMEFWIESLNNNNPEAFSCGVSLRRPGKKEVFIKKSGSEYHTAVKESVKSLKNVIRAEH